MGQAKAVLDNVEFAQSAYAAIDGADALVLVTEWDAFRALDLAKIAKRRRLMEQCIEAGCGRASLRRCGGQRVGSRHYSLVRADPGREITNVHALGQRAGSLGCFSIHAPRL